MVSNKNIAGMLVIIAVLVLIFMIPSEKPVEIQQNQTVTIPTDIDISSCSATEIELSETSRVSCKAKNLGIQSATYDAILSCPEGDSAPTRLSIMANEERNFNINYENSGIIQTCKVTIQDIEDSEKTDSEQLRVSLMPKCDKPQPTPLHERVYTQYGCEWICNNIYSYDIDPKTCEPLTDYDRCKVRISPDSCDIYSDLEGYHCIAEGKRTTLNDYYDAIYEGLINPYVPEKKSNLAYLSAPTCDYVAQYGYELENGQPKPITKDYTFDYDVIGTEPHANILTLTEASQIPKKTNSILPEDNLLYLLIGTGALVLVYFIFIRKR